MQHTIIVPASGEITLDIPARFFYVKNVSTVGATFRLRGEGNGFEIDEEMGKGSKLSFLPDVVTKWTIKNNQAAQLTITIKLGLVYYEDDILSGEINISNVSSAASAKVQGFETTREIFAASDQIGTVLALNYGELIIVNKQTSTANAIVNLARIKLPNAGTAAVGVAAFIESSSVAIALPSARYPAWATPAQSILRNTKTNVGSVNCEMYKRVSTASMYAAYTGEGAIKQFMACDAASTEFDKNVTNINGQTKIVLIPGKSLVMSCVAAQQSFGWDVEIEEVAA